MAVFRPVPDLRPLLAALLLVPAVGRAEVPVDEPNISLERSDNTGEEEPEENNEDEDVEEPIVEPPLVIDPPVHRHIGYGGGFRGGYEEEEELSEELWLPFGLLDRMRLSPFHLSATTELGTHEAAEGVAALTLHMQMATKCSCNIGAYATLPTLLDVSNDTRTSSASGTITTAPAMTSPTPLRSGTRLGTMDVGFFSRSGTKRRSWIYRVGALLPTGSRETEPYLPSARVGDRVLELPRSAGARASVSKLIGWGRRPRMCIDLFSAFRFDAGVDVASVLARPGNPVHVIPRGGFGVLLSLDGHWTYSIDTALSVDPFVGDGMDLRWATGITARRARADGGGNGVLLPAVTLAALRTPEGWSASLLLDVTATMPMND